MTARPGVMPLRRSRARTRSLQPARIFAAMATPSMILAVTELSLVDRSNVAKCRPGKAICSTMVRRPARSSLFLSFASCSSASRRPVSREEEEQPTGDCVPPGWRSRCHAQRGACGRSWLPRAPPCTLPRDEAPRADANQTETAEAAAHHANEVSPMRSSHASEEQQMMRQSCRDFVDDIVIPFIRKNWQREWIMEPQARLRSEERRVGKE